MARITGAAVADLNLVFSFDWALQPDDAGQQFSFLPVPAVPPEGDARIVVVPSGPTAPDDANMRVIIEAINCARRSVLISTPYFVPNEAMAVALQTQRGGVWMCGSCCPRKTTRSLCSGLRIATLRA